jgi:hypothetical protein
MELPGAGYFYSLAALSMAFVGFTSIVVVLHQGTGKQLSPFHFLITSLLVELGLMATAFAILAPTLAICGISEITVWRISSTIMLAVLVPWLVVYPKRRTTAAANERMPPRVYIMIILGIFAVVALGLNVFGPFIGISPGPAALAITIVYVLAFASVAFIRTYSTFLRD